MVGEGGGEKARGGGVRGGFVCVKIIAQANLVLAAADSRRMANMLEFLGRAVEREYRSRGALEGVDRRHTKRRME